MATKQKTTEASQEKAAVMTSPVEQNTTQESGIMEPEKEIDECISLARESLESKRALNTLKKFIELNS